MNTTNAHTDVLQFFLPDDTLKWFDPVEGNKNESKIHIILEEKNNPPLPPWYKNQAIKSKGFRDITIKDFPIRGRATRLTFRRRTWEIEGYNLRIKRDIKLVADSTTLEQEFADFLKERS